jgi:hypothetical protein
VGNGHEKHKKAQKAGGVGGGFFRHDYKIALVGGILSKKRGLGRPRPELRSTLFSLLTKKACFFDTIALVDGIL